MTEEIVIEEKQPLIEVMSKKELEAALGSPALRKACLKSSDPELHLSYLNTVMRWHELEERSNPHIEESEIIARIRRKIEIRKNTYGKGAWATEILDEIEDDINFPASEE